MYSSQIEEFAQRNKYRLIFGGIGIIYFLNLFIDIMDVDAAQYASISMEMSQNGSYLEVYHLGSDYLDKPPLHFWLSSLSMSLFGINNFAYKFPSFLLALLSIYSTFRFSRLYYSKNISIVAAAMLATTQALFIMTNDVRTDTILLAFVIFSVWQLATFVQSNQWKNLILGFIGIAFAMMAKGPIGAVIPFIALGFDFLVRRQWKLIFNWKWLIGLVIVAILLIPLTYGLYTQFDLHPEKTAYGIKSPSGVRFFYWTQSFGRITGESEWQNDSSFFYFFHTILWDFQPWIIFLILGLINTVRSFFYQTSTKFLEYRKEHISFGGFLLAFFALSMSHYKLPHYIFITFPFAAIITSRFLLTIEKSKILEWIQIFFNSLFWLILIVGSILFFTPTNWFISVFFIILFVCWFAVLFKTRLTWHKIFFGTIVTSLAFNLNLSANFYPQLIGNYQGSSNAAKTFIKEQKGKGRFFFYQGHDHTLDFYSQRLVPQKNLEELGTLGPNDWIYTNAEGYQTILMEKLPFEIIQAFPDYPVTQLSIPFLYKPTRVTTLDTVYLIRHQKN